MKHWKSSLLQPQSNHSKYYSCPADHLFFIHQYLQLFTELIFTRYLPTCGASLDLPKSKHCNQFFDHLSRNVAFKQVLLKTLCPTNRALIEKQYFNKAKARFEFEAATRSKLLSFKLFFCLRRSSGSFRRRRIFFHAMGDREFRDHEKKLRRTPKKNSSEEDSTRSVSVTSTTTSTTNDAETSSSYLPPGKMDDPYSHPVYRDISCINGQINRMNLFEVRHESQVIGGSRSY